jgi:hypothetical protein
MATQVDTHPLSPDQNLADALAERVFTLAEPWRSRFIAIIRSQVDRGLEPGTCHPVNNGDEPSQSDLACWLRDRSLSNRVRTMLCAWTQDP